MKRFLAIGIACALCLAGYSAQAVPETDHNEIAEIGKGMENEGLMSQKDYIILRQIIGSVRRGATISDRDLDWSLSLLKEGPGPIARSRVMGMLSRLEHGDAALKEKVSKAIAPFLKSEAELERKYAERVREVMETFIVIPR